MNKYTVRILLRRRTLTFLVFLTISAILWYITKLSYVYQTEIPVKVSVAGNIITARTLVEGSGYKILAYRHFFNKPVEIPLGELELSPVSDIAGEFTIDPSSMQRALAHRKSDIKVVSVGNLPQVVLHCEK